jgi:hypothetical protein
MRFVAVLIIATVTVSSCGSREKASVPEVAKSLQSTIDPVKFEALQGFLPGTDAVATAGWEKKDMTGMALTVPMKGSQASMTLKKGESEVVVDIVDTVFNQSLYAPVVAYLGKGFYQGTGTSYKKAVSIGGQPAFEEWNKKDRTGGVTIVVGKRFLVRVLGTGVDTIEPVTFIVGQIDLTRLAELK